MHITADDIKLIHDFGWALMPYAMLVWFGIIIFKIKVTPVKVETNV